MERTKAYAFALLVAALVLLALSTAGLEGRVLTFSSSPRPGQAGLDPAVDRFGTLFAAQPFAGLLQSGNRRDVFATTHFNRPAPPPADPPGPKTRKVSVTFLGELRDSSGGALAFVRLNDQVKQLAPGGPLVHDWAVAAVNGSTLVLTNATQTNQVTFRQTLELTVPLP
jgi:hypothetical protein